MVEDSRNSFKTSILSSFLSVDEHSQSFTFFFHIGARAPHKLGSPCLGDPLSSGQGAYSMHQQHSWEIFFKQVLTLGRRQIPMLYIT